MNNSSASIKSEKSNIINTDQGPNHNDWSNQNFSSIMNFQEHNTSMFQNLKKIISTQWEDYRKNQKDEGKENNQISENYLNKLNVEPEEFQNYIETVKIGFQKYKESKNIVFDDNSLIQDQNLGQYLMKCFENVPSQFFEENFIFDFSKLQKNQSQLNETQEELTEYLDEVDLNLFYQIQSRFDEFLTVVINFNNMQKSIESCLGNIKEIRSNNQSLKKNLVDKSKSIINKKNKILKLEKTINKLQLMKTVYKTIPTINDLVESGKYQYAVDLLQSSEESYSQHKFYQLTSLSKYKDSISSARKKLEQNVSQMFLMLSLNYVIEGLNYTKDNKQMSQNSEFSLTEDSMLQKSMLDNSTFLNETMDNNKLLNISQYMEDQKLYQIPWKLQECQRNKSTEDQIARIVLQSFNLVDFSARNYRAKLQNHLKDFHGQFLSDLKGFLIEQLDQEQNAKIQNFKSQNNDYNNDKNNELMKIDYSKFEIADLMQKTPIEIFIKFIQLYVDIFKRTVTQQLQLNDTVIQNIFIFVQQQIENQVQINGEEILNNQDYFNKINEVVDDFHVIIQKITVFFIEKLTNLFQMKDLKDLNNLDVFKKFHQIFDTCESFIQVYVKNKMKIEVKGLEQMNQKLKKMLNHHNSTQFQKIDMSSLNLLRLDIERNFVCSFHLHQQQELKKDMENDLWTPKDINYEYYEIIKIIVIQEMQMEKKQSQQQSFAVLDQINDPNSSMNMQLNTDRIIDDDEIIMNKDKLDNTIIEDDNRNSLQKQLDVKIMKNELYIEENKYKVPACLLSLLKKMSLYIKLEANYVRGQSKIDTFEYLLNLIKYYCDYSYQLIADSKALNFKKMDKITSKNLSLCLLCLILINKHLIPPLKDKIQAIEEQSKLIQRCEKIQQAYKKKIDLFFSTITSILVELIQDFCEEIQELQWNNTQVKFTCPTKGSAQILQNTRALYLAIEEFFMPEYLIRIFEDIFIKMNDLYLPTLEKIEIENKVCAKRIEEELEYVQQEIFQLQIMKLMPSEIQKKTEKEIQRIINEKVFAFLADNAE